MTAIGDISTRIHCLMRSPPSICIPELCQLADRIPFKDLQTVFPQIVGNIFGNGGASEDWGLRLLTSQNKDYNFELLFSFLSPNGPLFKICYKLIGDPQLRYVFPTRLLPLDVFQMLESGRVPQFYLDILNVDPHTRQIISLSLNPFDYYIFHFAVHMYSTTSLQGGYDNWNTLYYMLACEYLTHFLPNDPNVPVLPHIVYFTGKTPAVSPMQTANRHSQFPSLLVCQELASSPGVTASASSQLHPRGEVWRSETVLQVFSDVWLGTSTQSETTLNSSNPMLQSPRQSTFPACEHVRIARCLVKQCLGFALKGGMDLSSLGELRRAALATLAPRALAHIRHLMRTWPLDISFRLVLELWFSFIQPWRYANLQDENINYRADLSNDDQQRPPAIDRSFIPFITENLLAYTDIFQMVVRKFLRLDLTATKNAIMLFRLTKVFSQSNLVQILTEVENSVAFEMDAMPSTSYSQNAACDLSNSYMNPSGLGISQLNDSWESSFTADGQQNLQQSGQNPAAWSSTGVLDVSGSAQYRPLQLGMGRIIARDLLSHMQQAHIQANEIIVMREERVRAQRRGFIGQLSYWFFGDNDSNDEVSLDEIRKVPVLIDTAIKQLAEIFSFDILENQSQSHQNRFSPNSSTNNNNHGNITGRNNFSQFNAIVSPKQVKERANKIKYLGDPDLQPIKTYENDFLVRILQQITSKINDVYSEEMRVLWERQDFVGILSREVLKEPCEVYNYCKDRSQEGTLITQTLPPRLSLRPLASHFCIFWFVISCLMSYFLGYGATLFILFVVSVWIFFLIFKSLIKLITGSGAREIRREIRRDYNVDAFNDSVVGPDWNTSRS